MRSKSTLLVSVTSVIIATMFLLATAFAQGGSENVCVSTAISVQSTANIGDTIPITFSITNCGTRMAGIYPNLYVFDPCGGNAFLYGAGGLKLQIPGGQTVTVTVNYTVPACSGAYRVDGTAAANHGTPSFSEALFTVP